MLVNLASDTPVTDAIMREVKDNGYNINIVVTGRTQSRKSTTALGLCLRFQKDFSFDRNVAIIDSEDMIDKLNLENARRGTPIWLDELGIGADNRAWHSLQNKAMNHIIQTYGWKGLILISTVPHINDIDKKIKKHLNYQFEMVGKSDRKRFAVAKVMELQYNEDQDKFYKKFPRAMWKKGNETDSRYSNTIVESFRFQYPPQKILDEYFERSNRKKSALGAELKSEIRAMKAKAASKRFDAQAIADKAAVDMERFVSEYNGRKYIDKNLIGAEFGIGGRRADMVRSILRKRCPEIEEQA